MIDLSSFAESTFRFSHNNVYFLFNCTQSITSSGLESLSQFVEADTTGCQSYRRQCTLMAEYYTTGHCVQLFTDSHDTATQLSLQHAMNFMGCSHFQFFVTKTGASDGPITEWIKAVLQLQWTDNDCWRCLDSQGSCVLDSTNYTVQRCTNCSTGGGYFPLNVSESSYCEYTPGCQTTSKIGGLSICTRTLEIVVSVIGTVFIVCLGALIYCCRRRIRRRRSLKAIEKLTQFPRSWSAWPIARQESSSGSNESDLDLNSLSERPLEYSYSSIVSATSSFSSIVGKGGFGVVYKGAFAREDQPGMQEIAVKVLEVRSKHSRKQFLNEVAVIGRIHHVNVVRLLGVCVQQEEHEMLVYEYVVNGSLDTWLFNISTNPAGGNDAEKELEWGQRYGIAVGVAKGLSYLHEECRHRIVHCDIKPQNILLDASMCPKIADFGLARLMSRDESRVVTLAKGTPGYMAPEFWVGGDIQLSTKADVYSYGMVLLELVSGRRNFAVGCLRFPTLACEAAMRDDFESIIDVRLVQAARALATEEQRFVIWQQVRTAVFVALWCIQEHPASRPCMSEVVQYLEGTAAVSEQPPWPAIASTSTTTPLPIISNWSYLQDLTPMSG